MQSPKSTEEAGYLPTAPCAMLHLFSSATFLALFYLEEIHIEHLLSTDLQASE